MKITRQQLELALNNGKSMCDIAKEFQVALSTIRYWCKKYTLKSQYSSFSTPDYKNKNKRKCAQQKNVIIDKINWKEVQKFYDEGGSYRSIRSIFNIDFMKISKAVKLGLLKVRSKAEAIQLFLKNPNRKIYRHSERIKKQMSIRQKQFLKDNPHKHPWRQHDKFKSKPCEKFKEFLKELNIKFIEEFNPEIEGRNFSIDIAFPDKMIAIEINGIQHYDELGNLKPYYQERHDLIKAKGWTIYEIFCRKCFNKEKIQEFLDKVINSPIVVNFDYFYYIPTKKEKNTYDICPLCSARKYKQAKLCLQCSQKKRRKVERPSKDELTHLVSMETLTKIGLKYGVSGNAVKKWCKFYCIDYK